jgi:hypothetical protein
MSDPRKFGRKIESEDDRKWSRRRSYGDLIGIS